MKKIISLIILIGMILNVSGACWLTTPQDSEYEECSFYCDTLQDVIDYEENFITTGNWQFVVNSFWVHGLRNFDSKGNKIINLRYSGSISANRNDFGWVSAKVERYFFPEMIYYSEHHIANNELPEYNKDSFIQWIAQRKVQEYNSTVKNQIRKEYLYLKVLRGLPQCPMNDINDEIM